MRTELGVKILRQAHHSAHKFRMPVADYLDREIAGVADKRLMSGCILCSRCHWGNRRTFFHRGIIGLTCLAPRYHGPGGTRVWMLYNRGLCYCFRLIGVSKKTTEYSKGHSDPWEQDWEEDFVTLNAAQAQALREVEPGWSAWQVVATQALCGLVIAAVAELAASNGLSVAIGAFAVVLPNALLARGMTRKSTLNNVFSGVTALLVWEAVKIALTLAMLLTAPWMVRNLSWPALMVGLVLTMKVHWLAMALWPKRPRTQQV